MRVKEMDRKKLKRRVPKDDTLFESVITAYPTQEPTGIIKKVKKRKEKRSPSPEIDKSVEMPMLESVIEAYPTKQPTGIIRIAKPGKKESRHSHETIYKSIADAFPDDTLKKVTKEVTKRNIEINNNEEDRRRMVQRQQEDQAAADFAKWKNQIWQMHDQIKKAKEEEMQKLRPFTHIVVEATYPPDTPLPVATETPIPIDESKRNVTVAEVPPPPNTQIEIPKEEKGQERDYSTAPKLISKIANNAATLARAVGVGIEIPSIGTLASGGIVATMVKGAAEQTGNLIDTIPSFNRKPRLSFYAFAPQFPGESFPLPESLPIESAIPDKPDPVLLVSAPPIESAIPEVDRVPSITLPSPMPIDSIPDLSSHGSTMTGSVAIDPVIPQIPTYFDEDIMHVFEDLAKVAPETKEIMVQAAEDFTLSQNIMEQLREEENRQLPYTEKPLMSQDTFRALNDSVSQAATAQEIVNQLENIPSAFPMPETSARVMEKHKLLKKIFALVIRRTAETREGSQLALQDLEQGINGRELFKPDPNPIYFFNAQNAALSTWSRYAGLTIAIFRLRSACETLWYIGTKVAMGLQLTSSDIRSLKGIVPKSVIRGLESGDDYPIYPQNAYLTFTTDSPFDEPMSLNEQAREQSAKTTFRLMLSLAKSLRGAYSYFRMQSNELTKRTLRLIDSAKRILE